MKNILLISILSISFINVIAFGGENGVLFQTQFQHAGKKYEAIIYERDLDGVPVWNENNAWPPLKIREAIKIAQGKLSTEWPGYEEWRLESVGLNPLTKNGHWVYVVKLTPIPKEPFNGLILPLIAIVKMDGKTVSFAEIK